MFTRIVHINPETGEKVDHNPLYIKEFYDYRYNSVAELETYLGGENLWNKPISGIEIHTVQYGVTNEKMSTNERGMAGILLMHYQPGSVIEESEDTIKVEIVADDIIRQIQIIQEASCPPVDEVTLSTLGDAWRFDDIYANSESMFRVFPGNIGRPVLNSSNQRDTDKWFTQGRWSDNDPDNPDFVPSTPIPANADVKLVIYDLTKRCILTVYKLKSSFNDISFDINDYDMILQTATGPNHELMAEFKMSGGFYAFHLQIIEGECTKFNLDLNLKSKSSVGNTNYGHETAITKALDTTSSTEEPSSGSEAAK